MSKKTNYTPPTVWTWESQNGGRWAKINRPISGATHDKTLPVGDNPLQLYSVATPNGVKVTMMLEELIERGFTGAEYDAYVISISNGDQFGSGFVDINPNSKIPALMDYSFDKPLRVFESGSILTYLAEKFATLIPKDIPQRTACLSWLFWQMSSAPYVGGGFGHFYVYAPERIKYAIDRFTMETKRQLDVLDKQLAKHKYICGDDYTIADIAIWPWYGLLVLGRSYDAGEFLEVTSYKNVMRWAKSIDARPATIRGQMVNRTWGDESGQLHERHKVDDFLTSTEKNKNH